MWKKDNQPAQPAEGFTLQPETKQAPSISPKQDRAEGDSRSAGYTALDRSSIRKEPGSGDPTIISVQSTASGEISGQSDVKIFGNFQGTIETPKNIVTIEPSGFAKATINARAIIIQGKVFGNITGGDTVHLVSTGTVEGDIRAVNVILDKGSTFNGSIEMVREKNKPAEGRAATGTKQSKPAPAAAQPQPQSAPKPE